MWAYSEPGRGTTFKIYLPRRREARAEAAAEERGAGRRRERRAGARGGGRGARARRSRRGPSTEAGYRVLEAENGARALEIVRRNGDRPALVLVDVVMPGMSGSELARRARAGWRPACRCCSPRGTPTARSCDAGCWSRGRPSCRSRFRRKGWCGRCGQGWERRAERHDVCRVHDDAVQFDPQDCRRFAVGQTGRAWRARSGVPNTSGCIGTSFVLECPCEPSSSSPLPLRRR